MEFLQSVKIQNQIRNPYTINLDKTSLCSTIIPLRSRPMHDLKSILQKIVHDTSHTNVFDKYQQFDNIGDANHYTTHSMFSYIKTLDANIILNLVIDTLMAKIELIVPQIPQMDLASYLYQWKSYKYVVKQLYHILKHCQPQFVAQNTKAFGDGHVDILFIVNRYLFFKHIMSAHIANTSLIDNVSKELNHVSKKNIYQVIDYVVSIHSFTTLPFYICIDRPLLTRINKHILDTPSVIYLLCEHINTLFLRIPMIKKCQKKIYQIANILVNYADHQQVMPIYQKFMQTRLINPHYVNQKMDFLVLYKRFEKKSPDVIRMIKCIDDVKYCRERFLKKNTVNNITIKPLVLRSAHWNITNTSNMNLIYPDEISKVLEYVDNHYKTKLLWQPTMGLATFDAMLGSKKVNISCTILQAIAIIYLGYHSTNFIPISFSKETNIPSKLALKLVESLFESNIITYAIDAIFSTKEHVKYVINNQNYNGPSKIDLRMTFYEIIKP